MKHQPGAGGARPTPAVLDLQRLAGFADAVVTALDEAREEVDALNVYPVPDGDTGTNLLVTAQAARDALRAALRDHPGDEAAALAALARGALLGACGNSGVIAAQLVGALVRHLGDAPDPPAGLAAALGHAARDAYAAVGEPVEGTILTVAQAAADAAGRAAGPGATVTDVVVAAADAAAQALARTPEQLTVLHDAGVVDAGGRGLCVVLDAARSMLTGRPVPDPSTPAATLSAGAPAGHPVTPVAHAHPHAPRGLVYEVMYLLDAEGSAVPGLRRRLAPLGDSLVVVGDQRLWNVHVHVTDPGAAIEAGIEAGRPHRVRVTALEEAARHGGPTERAVVAVTAGQGVAALFEAAGGTAVPARPGRRPDADALLSAILGTGAAEAVLLPNDRSTLAAATSAADKAEGEDVRVAVIPTTAQVQGLAALAVHDAARSFEDDVVEMTAAARHARSGAVTVATRRAITTAGTCEPGDVLGVIEGDFAVVGDDLFDVARDVLERLLGGGGELVTVLAGAEGTELADRCASYLASRHPMVEVTVYEGGQERYPLLVGVE